MECEWSKRDIVDAYTESREGCESLLPGEAQDEIETLLESIDGEEP